MKEKIKSFSLSKEMIIKLLIMATAFVLILVINLHTTYLSDDFLYTFKFKTGYTDGGVFKIRSLNDFIESTINHRNLWNGRITAHAILQIVMMFGETFVRIFNSFMYVLCGALIYRHVYYGRLKEQPMALGLIYVLMWFFIPQFGATVVWASGAANYLWMTDYILLFLLPYRMYAVKEDSIQNSLKNAFLMFIFGLLVGCSNENVGGGVLLICISFMIVYKIKGMKIPVWSMLSSASVLIGYIVLITAPASEKNIASPLKLSVYIDRLSNVTEITKGLSFGIILIMIVFFALKCLKRKKSFDKNSKYNYLIPVVYFIGSLFVIIPLILSKRHPERVWFFTLIMQITIAVWLFADIDFDWFKFKYKTVCFGVVSALVAAVFVVSYSVEFKNINSSYIEAKAGVEKIKNAVEAGDSSVSVDIVSATQSDYDVYSIATYLNENPSAWINEWAAAYYGIDKINGVKAKK